MKDLTEKIRVRIMQEAYDLADRNDSEGYNSVKVMCSDVLTLLPRREWVSLTDEEIMEMLDYGQYGRVPQYARNFVDAIEAKLKEKNHG